MKRSTATNTREVARRKRIIARMLVRQETAGLSCEEIAQKLAEPRNSRGRIDKTKRSVAPNGKAWSKATIARDIQDVETGWKREALLDTSTWKTRIIAGYNELLEEHWKSGNYEGVERVLAALRKLVGTDSDQVILFEQLQLQLSIAAQRVRAEFGNEPELAQRVYRAFTGNPRADVFAVPDPPERPKKPEEKN